jgi:hypothetical protein
VAASPPQVEVGLGDALGGAERSDGVITGRKPFEAFDPPTSGCGVGTGASRRVGHGGILREETDAIDNKLPVNHVIRRARTMYLRSEPGLLGSLWDGSKLPFPEKPSG